LRQNPFKEYISSDIFSKSCTWGFLIKTSEVPASKPAEKGLGSREVIGEAINAVNMLRGWPRAIKAPRADKEPVQAIQLVSWFTPVCLSTVKVEAITSKSKAGMAQAIIFITLEDGEI